MGYPLPQGDWFTSRFMVTLFPISVCYGGISQNLYTGIWRGCEATHFRWQTLLQYWAFSHLMHSIIFLSVCSSYNGHLYQLHPMRGLVRALMRTAMPNAFHLFIEIAMRELSPSDGRVSRCFNVLRQTGSRCSWDTLIKIFAPGKKFSPWSTGSLSRALIFSRIWSMRKNGTSLSATTSI